MRTPLVLPSTGGPAGPSLSQQPTAPSGLRFRPIRNPSTLPPSRPTPNPPAIPLSPNLPPIPLALATSAPKENAELITGRLGIARCFSAMVTGHEVKAAKPDPAIFLEAARRLGVPPSQCVVFEDSPAGVAAAVRAGARCVALATSVPAEKLLAEGARLALADFEGVDAEALLEQAAR